MSRGRKAGSGVALAFLMIALLVVPAGAEIPSEEEIQASEEKEANGGYDPNPGNYGNDNDNDNDNNNNNGGDNDEPIVVAELQPPITKPSGATYDPNLNVYYGNTTTLIGVITGGKPAANNPVNPTIVRSANRGCDFTSGTHNLEDTRAMFQDRCGEPWNPYDYKCDYSSSGWRCFSL